MIRSAVLILLFSSVAFAQRALKEIPSVDPAEEQRSFQLAEGLEVNLFASEPMVRKPIQMVWDAKGRLWVASSAIYPHIKPGQTQSDQILILEDTDHDGKADKSTVFYEGLLIPTGIWPQDGGVYVTNSTELLFLQDTNGDDKADKTKVLLSGFGTEDTHHILHTIKGGLDGNLYFNQSVYIHSHIETPFGVRRLKGSGIWQYQPRTGRLEVFSMGQINPWGHIFDDWGQSFTTDGAHGQGINYVFPGATHLCLPNQLPRILKGLNTGQPKQCGLVQINGRHFSDAWQGHLITNDFRGHRVNRFNLSEDGSGYRSQQLSDVVSTTHGSFRPVDANIGPDGCLYLADWFNPIIQHGEVDFHDERRDQVHGRIWRISEKGRPLAPRVNLAELTTAQLIEQLQAPEQALRYWTKQELKSRKIPNLLSLLSDYLKKNSSPNAAVECLWTAQTSGVANFSWIMQHCWLDGNDGKVNEPKARAAALRAIRQLIVDDGIDALLNAETTLPKFEALCQQMSADPHPQVRLECLHLLRAWGSPRAVEIATQVLRYPMDENLDFTLWRICYDLSATWMPAWRTGKINFTNSKDGLMFALKSAATTDASNELLEMVINSTRDEKEKQELILILGSTVTKANISRLLDFANDTKQSTNLRSAALEALIVAAEQRKLQPANLQPLLDLIMNTEETIALSAMRLAGLVKYKEAQPALEKFAAGTGNLAATAQRSIAAISGRDALAILKNLLPAQPDATAQSNLLLAMMQADLEPSTPAVVEFLVAQKNASPDTEKLISAYLTQAKGPVTLAQALEGKTLNADVASQALQKTSSSGGDTKSLIEALTKAGGLTAITQLSEAQLLAFMEDVKRTGSAERGEAIYRSNQMQCTACHAIGPVGGVSAPNLVSIGSSAPLDYIIQSLLVPSEKIKEGYATAMIQMKDGSNFTGFLTREDDNAVILTDAAGQVRTLPKATISKKDIIPISMMPAGLTQSLRRDEFIDLVRFLSELGKEGAYKLQEDGTLRLWRAQQDREGKSTLVIHSLVNGTLPLAQLPIVPISGMNHWVVESSIEVLSEGEIVIETSPAAELVWKIDGTKVSNQDGNIRIKLAKGIHTLQATIPATYKNPLRVRLVSDNAKPVYQGH